MHATLSWKRYNSFNRRRNLVSDESGPILSLHDMTHVLETGARKKWESIYGAGFWS